MKWGGVRDALNGLDWDSGVDAFPGLPWEWSAIVAKVLAVQETLGPLAPDDPLTTLAVATAGATKASGAPAPLSSEVRSASLLGVWEAPIRQTGVRRPG